MKGPGVTTTDDHGKNKTLYLPNISSIEERTRPNLKKTLHGKPERKKERKKKRRYLKITFRENTFKNLC